MISSEMGSGVTLGSRKKGGNARAGSENVDNNGGRQINLKGRTYLNRVIR